MIKFAMGDILTKKAFAEMTGVSAACVSQWISRKKISGDALVGKGCRAQIRVEAAREQLKRNLDMDQRTSLGMGAKARLGPRKPGAAAKAARAQEALAGAAPIMPEAASEALSQSDEGDESTIEGRIKGARLEQIALSNAAAREEAAARSGRYVRAEDARQELGRVASRLMTLFESSLPEFANAVAAKPSASSRDALSVLRATWREIRIHNAKTIGAAAEALSRLAPGDGDPDACER